MMRRVFVLVFTVLLSQACSLANINAKEEAVVPLDAATAAKSPEDIKEGDNISKILASISVQDSSGKNKSFKSFTNNKESVIIFVKPGCVFCESFEAILDSTKPKIRPSLVMVMDSAHASLKDLNESKKKHPNIKAIWLYDNKDNFKKTLGVVAFPKFIHIDKNGKLLHMKNGLIVPENNEELKTLPFAEILQKLSLNTVSWLGSL